MAQTALCAVIDNGGRTYCTVWGDIMTCTAKTKGIEGTLIDGVCRDINGIMDAASRQYGLADVVIDGSCRDSEDIRSLGFPVFVRGFNPSGTPHRKNHLGNLRL